MKVFGSRIHLSSTCAFVGLLALVGFFLTLPSALAAPAIIVRPAWCAGDKCSDFFGDSTNCATLATNRCDFNNNLASLMCVPRDNWGCGINNPAVTVRCTGVCNADGVTPCNANVIQCTTNFPPP